jgi:sulfur-oxidizing protein SoxX
MTQFQIKTNITLIAASLLGLIYLAIFSSHTIAQEAPSSIQEASNKSDIDKGQELAFTRKKGNCLACHFVQDGSLTGNTGPALIAMKARFPKREDLYNQIFDARVKNINTIMPPFGAHGALTKAEIELIVTWLYTL